MTTGLAVFDTTVNETNEWLKSIEATLGRCERHQAYLAARAVLHALRDRLSPSGAARLSAQLPMLLRGVYFEGWRPDETPVRTHTAEAFIAKVAEALPRDFPIDPETVTQRVIDALWWRMNGGALEKAKNEVPADIAALWPSELLMA